DTVGFIRKLTHNLIESFKSTLAEVQEADLLLHVVDISNSQYLDQIRVVRETLSQIKAADKPTLIVFNKIDNLASDDLEDLEASWVFHDNYPCVFISAAKKIGLEKLRNRTAAMAADLYRQKFPGLEHYNFNQEYPV